MPNKTHTTDNATNYTHTTHYSVIAIDGPSASGKGTIAKRVANRLHFSYLDSGAIYRTVALYVLKNKLAKDIPNNINEIASAINTYIDLSFIDDNVYLNNVDVTNQIRTEDVGMMASTIGKYPSIRTALLHLQRDFALKDNLVTDGRDMGSVVFPNADLKVFLTAAQEKRAERRYNQLVKTNDAVNFEDILQDIITRDTQDSNRDVAPLMYTKDYKLLDNTYLTIEESVEEIINWFHGH